MEARTARRRIGQEQLGFTDAQSRQQSSLDEVSALVDWTEVARLFADIPAAPESEPGWPPQALFRALLLADMARSIRCGHAQLV
jgi:IS5 family transposase